MRGQTKESGHTLRAEIDMGLTCDQAFDTVVDEMHGALRDAGMRFQPGPVGSIALGEATVGRVTAWERGKRFALRWVQAPWKPDEVTEVEIRFEPAGTGTRVSFEHRGWGTLLGDEKDVAGWFAGNVIAPLVSATAPDRLGDWITDRRARRPSGESGREVYRDPLYHKPGFRALLEELALSPADRFLEVGCGGGVMMKQALRSGCTAAGVDHSPSMVQLAREINRESLRSGKLEIVEGEAGKLPFPDRSFTCAAMFGVFGFIDDPVAALKELKRVLVPGGRIVILGSDPAMRGTPAAPEPMASRIRFYEDRELEGLALSAGYTDVRVIRRSLETFAREAGIAEEALPLFAGKGAPYLIARTPP